MWASHRWPGPRFSLCPGSPDCPVNPQGGPQGWGKALLGDPGRGGGQQGSVDEGKASRALPGKSPWVGRHCLPALVAPQLGRRFWNRQRGGGLGGFRSPRGSPWPPRPVPFPVSSSPQVGSTQGVASELLRLKSSYLLSCSLLRLLWCPSLEQLFRGKQWLWISPDMVCQGRVFLLLPSCESRRTSLPEPQLPLLHCPSRGPPGGGRAQDWGPGSPAEGTLGGSCGEFWEGLLPLVRGLLGPCPWRDAGLGQQGMQRPGSLGERSLEGNSVSRPPSPLLVITLGHLGSALPDSSEEHLLSSCQTRLGAFLGAWHD